MARLITTNEAYALIAQNSAEATRHMRLLYSTLAALLVFGIVWRLILYVERRVWTNMLRVDHDYDMGRSSRSQNFALAVAPTPRLWQRLIRAVVACVRKYLVGVSVPGLNMTLAETSIVVIYVGFMVYLLLDNAPNIPPSPTIPFTIIGIANRAGLLSLASLPLQVILASRLNPLSFTLGISYDKLQFLHRWVGRTTLALAMTHASCKLVQNSSFGDHSFRRFGLGAFVIAVFLTLFSVRYLRTHYYEAFVAAHVTGVIALVVLIWKHMAREKDFLVATIALWATDRILRWARLYLYNSYWRCGQGKAHAYAKCRLLSHDTTRLEVYKPDFTWWKPGAYCFVSTPGMPWWPQSHPFTIASRSGVSPSHTSEEHSKRAGGGVANAEPNLIFLIRARKGWTKRLHELAKRTEDITLPVVIDGPYDGLSDLHLCYDTVVLFAGGAGISWTLPVLTDLLARSRRNQSSVRRLIWVCVMRHYVNYEWFFNELEAVVHNSGDAWLDIRIHYTTNSEDVSLVPTFFRPGRPDIGGIIEDAVNSAQGRTFIGVSGPQGPSEEVRRCARIMTNPAAILRGDVRGDVTAHYENFGW